MKRSTSLLVLVAVALAALVALAGAPMSWARRAPLQLAAAAPDSPPRTVDRLGRELAGELLAQPHSWAERWQRLLDRLFEMAPNVVAAVVLLAIFWFLNRLICRLVRRSLHGSAVSPEIHTPALRLTRGLVWSVGLLAAANQLGLQVASVLAGLGVIGLAVSLAAQETLSNFIAGVVLLWDRPFSIGDEVTVGGVHGRVLDIGLRSTRLRTPEQLQVTIPNREVANQKIVNHTRYPLLRVAVPFTVGHDRSIAQVREVLLARVAELPYVDREPAPKLVAIGFGEAGTQLELRVWIRDTHREQGATFDLVEELKATLDRAGYPMPTLLRAVTVTAGAAASAPVPAAGAPTTNGENSGAKV